MRAVQRSKIHRLKKVFANFIVSVLSENIMIDILIINLKNNSNNIILQLDYIYIYYKINVRTPDHDS